MQIKRPTTWKKFLMVGFHLLSDEEKRKIPDGKFRYRATHQITD